jgi:hypothetical protein
MSAPAPILSKPESYMAQLQRKRGLDTECATDEHFVKALEENKVDHFEITQTNNGYSCYTRCLYKLKGDTETLYEDTGMQKRRNRAAIKKKSKESCT